MARTSDVPFVVLVCWRRLMCSIVSWTILQYALVYAIQRVRRHSRCGWPSLDMLEIRATTADSTGHHKLPQNTDVWLPDAWRLRVKALIVVLQ